MDDGLCTAIDLALRQLRLSPDLASFEWFGAYRPLSRRISRSIKDVPNRAQLVEAITDCLYRNFYCVGSAKPYPEYPNHCAPIDDDFVQKICDAGFSKIGSMRVPILFASDKAVVCSLAGLSVYLDRRAVLDQQDSSAALSRNHEHGRATVIAAVRRCWTSHASPGFVLLFGRNDLQKNAPHRVYLSLHASGVAEWIATITRHLDTANVAFRLKALANPFDYSWRLDSSVIYIDLGAPEARMAVAKAYLESSHCFRNDVPALTRRIGPGLSVAENHSGGESFGKHLCNLIAEARLLAAESGVTATEDIHSSCEVFLCSHHIDPKQPYRRLASNSDCIDKFEARVRRGAWKASEGTCRNLDLPEEQTWLSVAEKIGRQIVAQAFWHGDRCQWIGNATGPGFSAFARTLPPHIYNGTAGIGHFLFELGLRTQSEELINTAIAATRQALYDMSKETASAGLYAGSLGIALVAARLGIALGNGSIADQAFSAARRTALSRAPQTLGNPDLLLGLGGQILGFLALSMLAPDNLFRKRAVELGEILLTTAKRDASGWSWQHPLIASRKNLTGLSHGTAGIALALTELWRYTNDRIFLDAVESAVRYEDLAYCSSHANWPDYRGADEFPKFVNYWCHGAAGIILSRLCLGHLLDLPELPERVVEAAERLRQSIAGNIHNENANFNLCHGLAGNCEILVEASRWGHAAWEWQDRARTTALDCYTFALQCHSVRGSWPCGSDVDDLSLFLGRAGIGYAYLRLHSTSVPSVLAFDPAKWGQASA